MKNLLFCLIANVLFSFTGNAQGTLRAEFLKGKTQDQLIENFNDLSTEQKSDLWVEKMNQLLILNLSDSHHQLIDKMRDAHLNKDLDAFKNATLELAKITPDEDFNEMFLSLNDYNFSGTFIGKKPVSELTINEIQQAGLSKEIVVGKLKDCNCRWLCDFYAGGSHGNCRITSSGCGLFWASECTGYVGPKP